MLKRVSTLGLICLATSASAGLAQTLEKASGPKKPVVTDESLRALREKQLEFPVPGISFDRLKDTFLEARSGKRVHHALDIPAPRGTPVLSADFGKIIKVYQSKAGGLTLYLSDTTKHFIYYYAHLDRYRDGVYEGLTVNRGDTLGFVGTTGNAPPNTPHLHFAILKSKNIARWSAGIPLNPYRVFKRLTAEH